MLRILSWDTWKEPSRIQGLWLNLQQSLVPIVSLICLVLRIPTIRPNQKLIFSGNYQMSIEPKLEFVTGGVELLKAVLHGYAGGLIFMK